MDVYTFPQEFVNPKDKEKPEYGLQYAKAAYYSDHTYGGRLYHDDATFTTLIELAQGRQSVDGIRRLSGFKQLSPNAPDDGPQSLAYIDPQVLNLAPKYVNRAVAKMQRINYDIGLDAIDLTSINEKELQAAVLKSYYRFRETLNTMGVPVQAAFPDIDVSTLPAYSDEMMYDINTNPKLKKEISGELTLQLIMSMNNFNKKMREVDWDLVTVGRGHLHLYLNNNKMPRIERINPKYWGGSYVDNDDFEDQEYSFFLDCITVSQFIREAGQFYTQSELQAIVQQTAIRNSIFTPNSTTRQINNGSYDNLNYIPVMRFYFRSEDCRNYITRKNQYGSKIFLERSYDYRPEEKTMERVRNGESKIINNTYTSIYGGTWIIDSEFVYNYGLKRYPRTNLVDATLPIKTTATNFKEGRCVSFLSQMTEPLFMINVAWNKIKEILAREYIGIMEIDFNQLENVNMGRGGRAWSVPEIVQFMEMSKRLVKRSNTNAYGQSNGTALNFHQTGITLQDYFSTLSTAFMILENQTGTTLAESANKPDRLAVGVMKASEFAGDLDMEYLYDAHEYLYQRSAHHLLLLAQESKRNKAKMGGMLPALGKINSGYYDVPDDIAYCDYGMRITRQPTQEEWAAFYQDISIALKEGRISPADSAFVREVDNLKMARQVLANREILYQRQVQQQKQMDIKAQMQVNAISAEMKQRADMAMIEAEKNAKAELIILQGRITQALQQQKAEMDAITSKVSTEMKAAIEKQKGVDEIMKQALRNIPESQKVQMQREHNQLIADTSKERKKSA